MGRPLVSARLYLEDLESIVAIVARFGGDIEIAAGDSVATSVNDLADASRRNLKSVRITSTKSDGGRKDFIVDFERKFVKGPDNDPAVFQQVVDVADIVTFRRARWPILPLTTYIGAAVALASAAAWVWLASAGQSYVAAVLWVVLGLMFAFFGAMPADRPIRVRPLRRNEHHLRSPRHRVAWISSTIFFFLGALAGLLLPRLFG